MEHLAGQTLVKKNKDEVSADEALKDKEIIALYFSAHWCPPCREFTPILANFYKEIKNQELPLEVIFVSSDETEEGLFSYMNEAHGDWLAAPFGSTVAEKLGEKFDVEGIPTLIVIKKDGTVVSENGTDDVEEKGVNAYKEWSNCLPRFEMDHLKGQTLVNKNKAKVSADDALKDKEIIAFYFSAHWCPPCRMFTPVLADFYEEIKDQELPLEIIFVSSDSSEEALFDYMVETHGDWLAVPFGSPVTKKLTEQFNIQGIPTLIVVKKDGTVVSTNGRSDVELKGKNAFKDWSK